MQYKKIPPEMKVAPTYKTLKTGSWKKEPFVSGIAQQRQGKLVHIFLNTKKWFKPNLNAVTG